MKKPVLALVFAIVGFALTIIALFAALGPGLLVISFGLLVASVILGHLSRGQKHAKPAVIVGYIGIAFFVLLPVAAGVSYFLTGKTFG